MERQSMHCPVCEVTHTAKKTTLALAKFPLFYGLIEELYFLNRIQDSEYVYFTHNPEEIFSECGKKVMNKITYFHNSLQEKEKEKVEKRDRYFHKYLLTNELCALGQF